MTIFMLLILLKDINETGIDNYNLGTGHGYSVLEMINAFEKVNHVKINYQITSRRPGDIDSCYADPTYAKEKLHWEATKGIDEMCQDAYNFVINNQ